MANTSTNISLTLPELSDTTKIREDFNDNMNIIDGRFSATYMAVQAAASVAITGGSITGITDVTVADGGTGASTFTDGGVLLGSGTGAITAMAVLTDGQMIVGNGTTDPVAESGATLRTSIGAASRALDNIASCAINAALLLGTSDAAALGSATKMWSDLFLASGGVIYFNNTDVTLTHSANTLTLGGTTTLALGATSITMTGSLADTTNRVTKGWFTDLQVTNNIAGGITGNAATATLATTFTCTDNESESLACPIVFVDGATGAQGAETDDTDFTYNPSTGNISATQFEGIVAANLVDKSASETIAGGWSFTGAVIKSGSTALTLRRVDDTAGNDPHLHFQRKQTTSPFNVENADELGHIAWYGWHTSYNYAACIKATVDGTPGSGDMPTKMTFLTSADASATPTLAMTIDSSQVVTFANALANGTTATTQSASDNSTKLSTTAYVDAAVAAGGGGNVSKVGTPADNQIGVWTGDGTIEGSSVFTLNATVLGLAGGTFDITRTNTAAGGDAGFTCHVEQGTNALTGVLWGAYITASNAQTNASSGTIRAIEAKARAEAVGESGGTVTVLEGISISADSKDQSVTTMRGIEVMLDGSTGGTVTEGVGIRIANNMQADKTTTMTALQIYSDSFAFEYGIDMSQGVGGITTDIKLSNGETIANNVDGIIDIEGELDMNAHTIGFTAQTATGDGTTTIDWKLGNKIVFTFGAANETFTFTAPTNPCNLLLHMIQDGTGSRLATWPGTVKWPAGTAPTLTTTGGGIDIISFWYDGTSYHGNSSLAFAVPA